MYYRILGILSVFTITMLSCNNERVVNVDVNSKLDTISYCIGVVYAQNLHKDGFDTINPWLISKGLDDVFDERKLLIEKDEAKQILMEHYAEIKRKQLIEKFEDVKLAGEKFLNENKKNPNIRVLEDGLQYLVLKRGTGPKPKPNDVVKVYYKGSLLNGEVFEEHLKGDPIPFAVNRVIQGWKDALPLMSVGSKWRLFIPYDLAYGTEFRPNSDIVPYSTLVFDLELVSID